MEYSVALQGIEKFKKNVYEACVKFYEHDLDIT